MNTTPYEVIAAPFDVYFAPAGTARPDLAIDPVAATPVAWTLVGSSGALNYDSDAGVTVAHEQATNPWRSLGDAGSRKIFRSTEDLKIALQLADLTLEQYKHALNSNTVTDTAGATPLTGNRKIGLSRGFAVATVALLIRGRVSPYGDGTPPYGGGSNGTEWSMQYWIPRAAQSGNPTVVFKKDTPALLALEWMALVDPTQSEFERFGVLEIQDADAS
jgi:hypothetical protein